MLKCECDIHSECNGSGWVDCRVLGGAPNSHFKSADNLVMASHEYNLSFLPFLSFTALKDALEILDARSGLPHTFLGKGTTVIQECDGILMERWKEMEPGRLWCVYIHCLIFLKILISSMSFFNELNEETGLFNIHVYVLGYIGFKIIVIILKKICKHQK